MPRLSELTDYNYDPMGNATGLPVEQPIVEPVRESSPLSNNVDKILNSLFRDDEERLQLWPEKLIRSGATAAGRALTGEIPQWSIDKDTGEVHTSPQMIEAANEMAALAGTGGLASSGGTLNATPSLRPALKYKDKLYKGKPGQQHLDVIPNELYPEFQKMAMSGEDISHYNFGFLNDKGHFLDREAALKYGIDNGLIDPQAGKFGALTSTLFADSSKPGVAIEAMKKAPQFFSAVEHNLNQIPQAKMTGDQWLGTLSNKPGVKVKQTGINKEAREYRIQEENVRSMMGEDKKIYLVYNDKDRGMSSQFNSKKQAEDYIAGRKEWEAKDKGTPIHYIDIPQSLRDTAMNKGFPLFSKGGYQLIPVQGNPFENDK